MAHHCIKYRLNADGTIPSFLCLHENGVGGMFVVGDPETPSPRDMVMIGLSDTDDTGDAEVIPTQADLQAYLTAVGANWTQHDPAQPGNPEATIPFDPVAAAQWVWDRKVALDAAG
jgi:hypothetical protein